MTNHPRIIELFTGRRTIQIVLLNCELGNERALLFERKGRKWIFAGVRIGKKLFYAGETRLLPPYQ